MAVFYMQHTGEISLRPVDLKSEHAGMEGRVLGLGVLKLSKSRWRNISLHNISWLHLCRPLFESLVGLALQDGGFKPNSTAFYQPYSKPFTHKTLVLHF